MIDALGLTSPNSSERVIDIALALQMLTPTLLNSGDPVGYGPGLTMETDSACLSTGGLANISGHSGSNGAARASLYINRLTGEVFAMAFRASNSDDAAAFHSLINTRILTELGWDDTCAPF
jgi:hypothetical protein